LGPKDPLGELERKLAREVVSSRDTVREGDPKASEMAPLLARANVAAALGVPMFAGDRLVGVLQFFRVKDAKGRDVRFGDAEIEIGTRLSDHAAAAATRFVGSGEES
jgi:GAF domain-containing protein